jgi:hypothetical protein
MSAKDFSISFTKPGGFTLRAFTPSVEVTDTKSIINAEKNPSLGRTQQRYQTFHRILTKELA